MTPDPSAAVERHLRAVVESSPSGLIMTDAEGHIVLVNREAERLFGYTREELIGRSVDILVPEHSRAAHPGFREAFRDRPEARAMGAGRDLFGVRSDGREVPVEIGLNPVHTDEGLFVIASIVDITPRTEAEDERRRLEGELRQAQKLESLGTLAGGVAHDFNNILAAIVGFAELARDASRDRPAVRADLDELLRTASRGKELVERILRFSRRQEEDRGPLDLAETVSDTVRILRATLPTTIDINLRVTPGIPPILGNGTAVQQVLLNLANNAAQAMSSGGRLSIALESLYLRDHAARAYPALREGMHAVLTVEDEGVGMDPETRDRALDPFFTTKAPGQGSGLGLTLVHGIVRDHGGAVELTSAPGRGTRARCLFPLFPEQPVDTEAATEGAEGVGARILYVDDEHTLVDVGVRRLKSFGYRVTGATSSLDALEILRGGAAKFDVLITDLTMPGLTGLDLAAEARQLQPDLGVILLSGYPAARTPEELEAVGISLALMKPISGDELHRAVESVVAQQSVQ